MTVPKEDGEKAADARLAKVLRERIPRHIVLFLLDEPGSSVEDIAKSVGIPVPRIDEYVQQLLSAGVVRSSDGRDGEEGDGFVVIDPASVRRLEDEKGRDFTSDIWF